MKINKRTVVLTLIMVLLSVVGLYAQTDTRIKDFYSPLFLSGLTGPSEQFAPQSDSVNPASSALSQRTTVDINYSGIVGDDGGLSGQNGFAFNLGNTVPTRIGVFSWSTHMFKSDFPGFYAPFSFTAAGSFSKDLFPNLLVGTGLKLAYSSEPGYAAALDLGVIYLKKDLGFLKDAAVGVSLNDMGWTDIDDGYQPMFTPSAGISGTVFSDKNFKIRVDGNFSLPGVDTVYASTGVQATFRDSFSLIVGSRLDFDAFSRDDYTSLIPSVGFSFRFNPSIKEDSKFLGLSSRGWNKGQVDVQTSFAPLSSGVWAYGAGATLQLGAIDKDPPEIKLDLSGFDMQSSLPVEDDKNIAYNVIKGKKSRSRRISPVSSSKTENPKTQDKSSEYRIIAYISPNNDGVKDDLRIPLTIKDSRYIKGYSFIITDENGNVVREIRNKEKRYENEGFKGFFGRLFAVKSGIDIPKELRWDGYSSSGSVVKDGLYLFHVEAWDDNGNKSSTPVYGVIVDDTPPSVTVIPPSDSDKIFSPNGDGNKDTVEFDQSGSAEDKWIGTIRDNNDKPVRTFTWENGSPGKVVWDGKDDSGKLVADGVYSYLITATDRAGNSVEDGFQNIIKNTEVTPISLKIDKQFFSPNNDGIKDTILFTPEISVENGIVKWSLEIIDSDNRTRRTFDNGNAKLGALVYDGRDDEGLILEEGTYHAVLKLVYENGNNPSAVSPDFTVDVTPPSATVRTNTRVFSPNGDGRKDVIKIYQETSLEKVWTASIVGADGEVKYDYKWIGTADPEVDWNGIGKDGRLCPDQIYTYQLSSVDRAGNSGKSNMVSFKLDTEQTAVILTTEYSEFSPNGDGVKDNIKLIPELTVKDGISEYTLSILNEDGTEVKKYEGKKGIPQFFSWDGNDMKGIKVPDGKYRARLDIVYEKGDRPHALSEAFSVDTRFPEISLKADYLLFSPDGDGRKDSVKIIQSSPDKELWKGEITDSKGNIVKTVFWKNGVTDFSWDGTDTAGNLVPDGTYTYTVSATDAAGNLTRKEIKGITVDTSVTKVFITSSDSYISPTGNGQYEDITFKTIVTNKKGIDSWSLKLVNETTGKVEREFSGESRIPEKVIWDGSNSQNKFSEGVYHAVFKVIYKKGNEPEAKTAKFILDVSPPSASMKIYPLPFSPDNDGVNDELTISLSVKDLSGVKDWKLDILDPEKQPFISFKGNGTPAENIIWNGRSATGELVYAAMDYPTILTVEDILGNVTVVKDVIPIDVLVVKEGDVLKIKIANIIFKKNSAELVDDDPKTAATNEYVLNRISEILKKYKSYQIDIVGHAVVTKWYDPEAAKIENETELIPLSRERALTVLKDLEKRGISASRMKAVGAGGADPLVPNSDLENRWKNRRVEFLLRKK